MADRPARSGLSREPIAAVALTRALGGRTDGAVVTFEGRVRSRNGGRSVRMLHYEAYDAMASAVLSEIATEARDRFEIADVVVRHRLGSLEVGAVSLAIAACAPHRAPAFDAVRYVIEQIKERVPIWKREEYEDGSSEWLGAAAPRPGGSAPRDPGIE